MSPIKLLNYLQYLCSCVWLLFYVFPGGSNVGDTLPTGQLSNIPWRRAGVKYTNNEAYFDVIEEIDAIVDKSGTSNILALPAGKYFFSSW